MDITIYMSNVDDDVMKTITSTSSKFSLARIKRGYLSQYTNELNKTGLYFLLIGNDSVYVGESGLDTIGKRIKNSHAGTIDSLWHTVIGFPFSGSISKNELYYLENALCEYAHKNQPKCLTTTPSKEKCNVQYRDTHYQLTTAQINACKQYLKEIITFIGILGPSIFPKDSAPVEQLVEEPAEQPVVSSTIPTGVANQQEDEFDHDSARRNNVELYCTRNGIKAAGIRTADGFVVKKGSTISENVTKSCRENIVKRREQYSDIIKDCTLTEDILFSSPSAAASFVYGGSANGNVEWKTRDGVTLKEVEAGV